ncbi:DNA primase catalytic subunit PriS [Candidatus Borrarchaeum sp.]|uniref:DNA primase catalytic subunit PriS n=1 Tax=Candidatus Borrarchaeum sp. TaxID=2846742 RepID=UPI00257EA0BC|nr:DNA primase catalytic subunit PriS [Candidatus Borrarchaeum sp.]
MSQQKITKAMLQEYYSDYFDVTPLINIIGLSTFRRREFGFDLGNTFTRNLSFGTPRKLVDYMGNQGVFQAYVGAVYSESPSKQQSIQRLQWESRELVFDIDLDEFDLVRRCDCKGEKTFCEECWTLAQDAMIFLDATMREDFGIEDLVWIFSGRRGVHCWICDDIAKKLDQRQRSAVINYLTLIKEGEKTPHVDMLPKYAKSLKERIFTLLSRSFFLNTAEAELIKLGFKKGDSKKILKRVLTESQFNYKQFIPTYPSIDPLRLAKAIIINRYPRIDRKVTLDTRRLLKIPNSIHGKTGNVCVVINNISNFDPFDVPSIFDKVLSN